MNKRKKIRVLFLAANPEDQTRLDLGREFAKVKEALMRGRYRNAFQLLQPEFEARIGNFAAAIASQRPHIIHFSGHGSESQGLVFESEDRYSRVADEQKLASLFQVLRGPARLVFLNACHTRVQAEILGKKFQYTIGTNGLIPDRDAAEFSSWFYRFLADGATVRGAFVAAKAEVGDPIAEMCVLKTRPGVRDSRSFICQVLDPITGKCERGRQTPTGRPQSPESTSNITISINKARNVVSNARKVTFNNKSRKPTRNS